MPIANGTIQIEDYNGEMSSVAVNLQEADDAGTNYGTLTQDLDEVKDGVLLLIRGLVRNTSISIKYVETGGEVTDVEAAREGKWLVSYTDNTPYLGAGNTIENPGYNKTFTFEIPTADRTLLPLNSDELDLADTDVAAAVALIEPNIRSPYNRATGQTVTPSNIITSIRFVGRNV